MVDPGKTSGLLHGYTGENPVTPSPVWLQVEHRSFFLLQVENSYRRSVAPVIKVTGNPETYAKMTDNIDINAGRVITEGKTPQDIGAGIFDKMVAVANDELTKAEVLGHKEFGICHMENAF